VTIPSQRLLISPVCASIALLIPLCLDCTRASLNSNLPRMGRSRNMCDKKSLLKKRRRRSIIAFEMIRLDRSADEPLHQQLYRQIRDELKSDCFTDGASRLPSSRALAVDLGISRLTVRLAFSKLSAEGYLQPRIRSGTFIADPLPETFLSAGKSNAYQPIERPLRISDRVKAIPDTRVGEQFDLGYPKPQQASR